MIKPTSKTPEAYRERAEACERLANSATSADTREIMRYLAHRWRKLAEEDEDRNSVTNIDQSVAGDRGPS
jgi:hypothetical protein